MRQTGIVFITLLLTSWLLAGCSSQSNDTSEGYIEGQLIYLSSSTAGYLRHLNVQRGNFVKPDQIIFNLDPYPEKSQFLQAEAQLIEAKQNLANLTEGQRNTIIEGIVAERSSAQANLVLMQQTLSRYRRLYKTGAIDKQSLDQANANYKAAKQKVEQLDANLAEAKLGARKHLILAQEAEVQAAKNNVKRQEWLLEQKTIHAPQAGLIFDTYFRNGEFVAAGQAVASLLTADNTKLIFYLPEIQLSKIKLGQLVYFNCDSCQQKGRAHIDYISPQAEYTPPVIYSRSARSKLVYRIEATILPKDAFQFHPGQPVDVTLTDSGA